MLVIFLIFNFVKGDIMNFKKIFATSLSVLFISTPVSLQAMVDENDVKCTNCSGERGEAMVDNASGEIFSPCGCRVCHLCVNDYRWNKLQCAARKNVEYYHKFKKWLDKQYPKATDNAGLFYHTCSVCEKVSYENTDLTERFKQREIVDVRDAFQEPNDEELLNTIVFRYCNAKLGQWLRCSCEGHDNEGVLFLTDGPDPLKEENYVILNDENFVTVDIDGKIRKLGIADPLLRRKFEFRMLTLLSYHLHCKPIWEALKQKYGFDD